VYNCTGCLWDKKYTWISGLSEKSNVWHCVLLQVPGISHLRPLAEDQKETGCDHFQRSVQQLFWTVCVLIVSHSACERLEVSCTSMYIYKIKQTSSLDSGYWKVPVSSSVLTQQSNGRNVYMSLTMYIYVVHEHRLDRIDLVFVQRMGLPPGLYFRGILRRENPLTPCTKSLPQKTFYNVLWG